MRPKIKYVHLGPCQIPAIVITIIKKNIKKYLFPKFLLMEIHVISYKIWQCNMPSLPKSIIDTDLNGLLKFIGNNIK